MLALRVQMGLKGKWNLGSTHFHLKGEGYQQFLDLILELVASAPVAKVVVGASLQMRSFLD
jgi:hypothetical protein